MWERLRRTIERWAGTAHAKDTRRCSFCNKSQNDVKKLIAGPNVFICDECVGICVDAIGQDERAASSTAPSVNTTLSPPVTCSLCGVRAAADESLLIPDRGQLCPACAGAVDAALEDRRDSTP